MIPAGRDLRGYHVQSPHCADGETEAQSELVTEPGLRHGFHSPFIHSLSAGCKRLLFLKGREMDPRRNNHSVSGPRETEGCHVTGAGTRLLFLTRSATSPIKHLLGPHTVLPPPQLQCAARHLLEPGPQAYDIRTGKTAIVQKGKVGSGGPPRSGAVEPGSARSPGAGVVLVQTARSRPGLGLG